MTRQTRLLFSFSYITSSLSFSWFTKVKNELNVEDEFVQRRRRAARGAAERSHIMCD